MGISRKQVVINSVRDYILTGRYTDRETARRALFSGIEEAIRNGIAEKDRQMLSRKVDFWFRKKRKTLSRRTHGAVMKSASFFCF